MLEKIISRFFDWVKYIIFYSKMTCIQNYIMHITVTTYCVYKFYWIIYTLVVYIIIFIL